MDEEQPDTATTEELLGQVRAGNRQGFEQLFARHQQYLYRVVELRLDQRLRSRVGPEDIVQEAYLEALHRLDAYLQRPALPFRLWLRQIAFEGPRPPRRLDRSVPRELETIVLKAMARAPEERYATAAELAGDLERFLEDEPIRARRPTLLQRARKWARRHRPVVWSAAAALVVALAVLAGSAGWVARDQAARQARISDQARSALREARRCQEAGQWAEARSAARRAEALLAGDSSADLQRHVRDLLADLRMVARLEEVRLLQSRVKDGKFDGEGTDDAYAAAFRDYGIDVEALDAGEASRRIAARSIRVELAAALDGWSQVRRCCPRKGGKSWRDLLALAQAADDDPRRTALRDAIRRGDRRALGRWDTIDRARPLPPATLVLLAGCVEELCGLREALACCAGPRSCTPATSGSTTSWPRPWPSWGSHTRTRRSASTPWPWRFGPIAPEHGSTSVSPWPAADETTRRPRPFARPSS